MSKSSTKKNSDLPLWEFGTDRQRGRSLWRYLRDRGRVPALQRREGRLQPVDSYTKRGHRKISFPRDYISAREVNSSIATAMSLAARGEFVAAGAVYYLVMSRMSDEQKKQTLVERTHIRRQMGALKVRNLRSIKALERERAVVLLKASSGNLSSEAIRRRLKIPASTVRRILKKHRNIRSH